MTFVEAVVGAVVGAAVLAVFAQVRELALVFCEIFQLVVQQVLLVSVWPERVQLVPEPGPWLELGLVPGGR